MLLFLPNGNPLQYSCLENPIDGGAWQAIVHVVAKSQTRLSDFTFFTNAEHSAWRLKHIEDQETKTITCSYINPLLLGGSLFSLRNYLLHGQILFSLNAKYSKFFTIYSNRPKTTKYALKCSKAVHTMLKNTKCLVKCSKDVQKMLKQGKLYVNMTILSRLSSCCQGHNEHQI